MDQRKIREMLAEHRQFFASGRTRDIAFRRQQLEAFGRAIRTHEAAIYEALKKDLNKPSVEAYGGEIGMVLNEIDHALRNLRTWTRPRRFRTPLVHQPASSWVFPEPYGVVLIVSPWNFPFQLTFMPLVGAMAAGNCSMLKPPIVSPHSASLIASIVSDTFDPAYVSVVQGGAETGQALLEERFDYIFFTGGPYTGRQVMQAAAKHLTPVTLELGGKNPCIVDADTRLDFTARRIAWGKFFNAGQNCIAVDYLLVDRKIGQQLLERIAAEVKTFYGPDPAASSDYARIIDKEHCDRLVRLMKLGRIAAGGRTDEASRFIEPTIIDGVAMRDPIMEEEIFGPLLPVIEYDTLPDAIAMVNSRPKPLTLYFFSRDRAKQERVLREISSGCVCINDTLIHETWSLPFGGVGESGMGKYHGKASFDTFSHQRSVMKSSFLFDLTLRYPPYGRAIKWIKKLF
jgi:acyl-CoA reductase-like NAD-dependent aldehyde dehydrogenase